MSHRHRRQNVGKYKILQMWWGRKRRRKKVKHCNIRIIDRLSFGGKKYRELCPVFFQHSCFLFVDLFPFFKIVLLIFLVKVSKSECVSHVWQAAKSGDICMTCDMSLKWLLFWDFSMWIMKNIKLFYFILCIRLFPFMHICVSHMWVMPADDREGH